MSATCCQPPTSSDPKYGRVLWVALVVNAVMFFVEIIAGSLSLQADAIDFLGDAGNYALSLWAVSRALKVRARVATFKGITMGLFGLWVLVRAVMGVVGGEVPHAEAMGVTALVALVANFGVAVLLYRDRNGDSNMRSVWLCTRNDVLGNLAVLLAAGGVFALTSRWPDLLVAGVISSLALMGAFQVLSQARREQRDTCSP